jgi:hypothetical protein
MRGGGVIGTRMCENDRIRRQSRTRWVQSLPQSIMTLLLPLVTMRNLCNR